MKELVAVGILFIYIRSGTIYIQNLKYNGKRHFLFNFGWYSILQLDIVC